MTDNTPLGDQHREKVAIQRLTTMLILFAALIGMLGALISLTETPQLAYNGGPMGFGLAVVTTVTILYAADFRRRYDV